MPTLEYLAEIQMLKEELNKTKKALRDTANGRPSEWAYVQLKNDADKLAEALEQCLKDMKNWTAYNKMEFKITDALKDYRGEK